VYLPQAVRIQRRRSPMGTVAMRVVMTAAEVAEAEVTGAAELAGVVLG
jgi:hypothetical protein